MNYFIIDQIEFIDEMLSIQKIYMVKNGVRDFGGMIYTETNINGEFIQYKVELDSWFTKYDEPEKMTFSIYGIYASKTKQEAYEKMITWIEFHFNNGVKYD